MALLPATCKLKPENYQHSAFKSFIFRFVGSLCKRDRDAFRFWCIGVIPRAKLDIDVSDDGNIFRLIECLLDDCVLSFADVSFLRRFLLSIIGYKLLEELRVVESCVAIDAVLRCYGLVRASASAGRGEGCELGYNGTVRGLVSGGQFGSSVSAIGDAVSAHVDCTSVVDFLVVTRGTNHEKISQVMEELKQVGNDMEYLQLFKDVIKECQEWSIVAVLMIVLGELYPSVSSEKEYLEVFARWMLERGGVKAFEDFIRGKQKVPNRGCTLSLLGESLKEQIRLIGRSVDIQLST